MGRIADILTRVRDSLADEDEERWTTARLLRLVDEAQKDIATKAKLLRTKTVVSIIGLQAEYQLPSDAFLLTRVVNSDGAPLPIVSHDYMDELDPSWETTTGSTIEYIVFDKQNPGWLKVYPIPLESDGGEIFTATDYGVTATVEDDIVTPDYGVVADVSTNSTESKEFNSVYGVMTGMVSAIASLTVYYRHKPATINAIDISPSVLEIDDKWDKAIKHYVVGTALRDDQDTQNRAVGNDELMIYGGELGEAKSISAKNNAIQPPHQTTYNPGI